MIRDLINLLPFFILMVLAWASAMEAMDHYETRAYQWVFTNSLSALILGSLGVIYIWSSF